MCVDRWSTELQAQPWNCLDPSWYKLCDNVCWKVVHRATEPAVKLCRSKLIRLYDNVCWQVVHRAPGPDWRMEGGADDPDKDWAIKGDNDSAFFYQKWFVIRLVRYCFWMFAVCLVLVVFFFVFVENKAQEEMTDPSCVCVYECVCMCVCARKVLYFQIFCSLKTLSIVISILSLSLSLSLSSHLSLSLSPHPSLSLSPPPPPPLPCFPLPPSFSTLIWISFLMTTGMMKAMLALKTFDLWMRNWRRPKVQNSAWTAIFWMSKERYAVFFVIALCNDCSYCRGTVYVWRFGENSCSHCSASV